MTSKRKRKSKPAVGPTNGPDPIGNLFVGLGLVGSLIVLRYARPMMRSECREAHRPCPFVACKANLIIDVVDGVDLILNSDMLEDDRGEGANRKITAKTSDAEFNALTDAVLDWWSRAHSRARRMHTTPPDSCLEDVITRHLARIPAEEPITGMDLEDVGAAMFITRQRASQLEAGAMRLLRDAAPRLYARLINGKPNKGPQLVRIRTPWR